MRGGICTIIRVPVVARAQLPSSSTSTAPSSTPSRSSSPPCATRSRGTAPARRDAEWIAGIGTPLRTQIALFARRPDDVDPLVARYRAFWLEHHDRMTRPFPARSRPWRSSRRRGHPLAVVTAKAEEGALRTLRHAGLLPYLGAVIGADSCARAQAGPRAGAARARAPRREPGRARCSSATRRTTSPPARAAGVRTPSPRCGAPAARETLAPPAPTPSSRTSASCRRSCARGAGAPSRSVAMALRGRAVVGRRHARRLPRPPGHLQRGGRRALRARARARPSRARPSPRRTPRSAAARWTARSSPSRTPSRGASARRSTCSSHEPGPLIRREVLLPVRQHLLAPPGTRLEDIARVLSHPQPFGQCSRFLAREARRTRRSSRRTPPPRRRARSPRRRAGAAAIGSRAAADALRPRGARRVDPGRGRERHALRPARAGRRGAHRARPHQHRVHARPRPAGRPLRGARRVRPPRHQPLEGGEPPDEAGARALRLLPRLRGAPARRRRARTRSRASRAACTGCTCSARTRAASRRRELAPAARRQGSGRPGRARAPRGVRPSRRSTRPRGRAARGARARAPRRSRPAERPRPGQPGARLQRRAGPRSRARRPARRARRARDRGTRSSRPSPPRRAGRGGREAARSARRAVGRAQPPAALAQRERHDRVSPVARAAASASARLAELVLASRARGGRRPRPASAAARRVRAPRVCPRPRRPRPREAGRPERARDARAPAPRSRASATGACGDAPRDGAASSRRSSRGAARLNVQVRTTSAPARGVLRVDGGDLVRAARGPTPPGARPGGAPARGAPSPSRRRGASARAERSREPPRSRALHRAAGSAPKKRDERVVLRRARPRGRARAAPPAYGRSKRR